MRRLLGYMKPYGRAVSASLVLLLVNSVLQVVGPLLVKLAVDRYIVPAHSRAHTILDGWLSADAWTGIGQIALLYLGAVLGGFVCDFAETYLMQWTGQD